MVSWMIYLGRSALQKDLDLAKGKRRKISRRSEQITNPDKGKTDGLRDRQTVFRLRCRLEQKDSDSRLLYEKM
jgi:hypothetical protein